MTENDPEVLQGRFAFSMIAEQIWPVKQDALVFQHQIDDRQLAKVFAKVTGVLIVEIWQDDELAFTLQTPKIIREPGAEVKVAFGWSPDGASLATGGKIVDDTSNPRVYSQDSITIKERSEQRDKALEVHLSETSGKAIKIRRKREKSRTAPDGKRLRTLDENLSNLHVHAAATRELLTLIRHHKKFWMLPSLAANLRMMVSNGGSNKPLLQMVAGQMNQPLFVHCYHPEKLPHKIGEIPTLMGENSYCWIKPFRESYEVDFDVWLELVGVNYMGVVKSNDELIQVIANSSAVHYDPTITPLTDAMLQEKSVGNSIREDFLVRTGAVVLSLSTRMIEIRKTQN